MSTRDFTQCDLLEDGQPDPKKLQLDWNTFYDAVSKYDEKGMACKVHVTGAGAVRRARHL